MKKDFDAIIFDLGGVILNIDYTLTIDAFTNLGIANFDTLYSQASQAGLFDDIETGKITEHEFVSYIQQYVTSNCSASQIIDAWNAMLLNWDIQKLELIRDLRTHFNIYLLSNTNQIHKEAFMSSLNHQTGLTTLDNHFDQVYLSHEIGMRKPNREIFEFVLRQHHLDASRTLFLDDSIQHIEGAKSLGIQTQLIDKSMDIIQFFS